MYKKFYHIFIIDKTTHNKIENELELIFLLRNERVLFWK